MATAQDLVNLAEEKINWNLDRRAENASTIALAVATMAVAKAIIEVGQMIEKLAIATTTGIVI